VLRVDRHPSALLALAVVAGLALGQVSNAAAASGGCTPNGSKSVAKNQDVRIFTTTKVTKNGPLVSYYACVYSRGVAVFMDSLSPSGNSNGARRSAFGGPTSEPPYYINAPFVAWVEPASGPVQPDDTILLFNLKTGKKVYDSMGTGTNVTGLVLNSRGSAAWILDQNQSGPQFLPPEVQKFDSGGVTTLDSGYNMAKGSLALSGSGSTIYWINAGVVKGAPLNP
jgi:hypothetical protein